MFSRIFKQTTKIETERWEMVARLEQILLYKNTMKDNLLFFLVQKISNHLGWGVGVGNWTWPLPKGTAILPTEILRHEPKKDNQALECEAFKNWILQREKKDFRFRTYQRQSWDCENLISIQPKRLPGYKAALCTLKKTHTQIYLLASNLI